MVMMVDLCSRNLLRSCRASYRVDRKPLVSVLGVPNHMTCRFLSVLWFFYPSLVGNANSQDRYSILIRLDDQYSVDSFYKHFNGKHFSSPEEETCHMFFTVDIQYTGSIELSQSSPGSSAEQPSSPVCLGSVFEFIGWNYRFRKLAWPLTNPEAYCLHNIGGIIWLVMILLLLMFVKVKLVLLICVTKVAKSAFDKALAEHEDIDDDVGSEEPTERDHGVDLQQPLLIKIDSSDSHQK
ncbi:hypothetical protein OROHE_015082 [Orobanche hederae]